MKHSKKRNHAAKIKNLTNKKEKGTPLSDARSADVRFDSAEFIQREKREKKKQESLYIL